MYLRFVSVLCIVLSLSGIKANAALMASHDMASLAHLSQLVVLVKEPDWKEEQGYRHAQCRVLQIFKDSRTDRTAVSTLPISIGTIYRREQLWANQENPENRIKPNRLLLFLGWNERLSSYSPVSSGVKLIEGDKVWAYEQQMNPGPFSPVEQRAELVKLTVSQKYDEATLLKHLALSLEESNRFEQVSQKTKPALGMLLSYLKLSKPKSWPRFEDAISQDAAKSIADNYAAAQWWPFVKANWDCLGWREKQSFKDAFRRSDNFDFLVLQPESSSALPNDSTSDRFSFTPEMRRLFEDLKNDDQLKSILQFSPKNTPQTLQMSTRTRNLVRLAKSPAFQFTHDDIAALAFTREARLSKRVLAFATQKFGDNLQNFSVDLPLFHAIVAYYGRVQNTQALELLAASTRYMRKGENGTNYSIYQPVIDLLQHSYAKDDTRLIPILLEAFRQNPDCFGGASRSMLATSSEKQAPTIIKMLASATTYGDAVGFLTVILEVDRTGQPATIEALKKLILDNSNRNQQHALDIASYYADPTLPPLLLQIAQDENAVHESRQRAIQSLGKLRYQTARPIFEQWLKKEYLGWAAAEALASIGTEKSLPFLIPVLDGPDGTAFLAVKAIAKITGQNFGPDYSLEALQAAKEWVQKQHSNLSAK